jgi:ketosteroid isomerase-like protein
MVLQSKEHRAAIAGCRLTLEGLIASAKGGGDTVRAMSQENVGIVRRVYDAANRNDWNAAFRDAHPDFELTAQRGPNAGTHRGREKVIAILLDQRAAFDAWIMEPLELLESWDQVVAIVKSRLRPKDSSGELEIRNRHIRTIRDERGLSMVGFPSPEEALEAAGLSE